MKTVVGIDVGTQSSKVIFYDFEKKSIAAVQSSPHRLISGDDGTSEQEAEWWIDAVRKAFSQIPDEIRKTAMAVSVSGQQHGFVPVDDSGSPLYRAKLWNDTSTAEECGEITAAFGGEAKLIEEAGNPILPGYTAGKILWLKKHEPALFAKLSRILLPHDYINYVLTGEFTMEYGDASGTGLLNIRNREWNRDLCSVIDPAVIDMLPGLRTPEEGAGWVTKEASVLFGIPEGIPVATGGGDNMMAAIGTGAVRDGSLTMSLGTSGTLFGFSSVPRIDPEGIIAAFCSSNNGWLPLLCTMNCTVATEQTRSLFSVDVEELDGIVGSVPPGSEGVTILPYFSGERIPNMPRARGSIMGLDMTNLKRENIIRASMEAAIYGMRIGLDSLKGMGMKTDSVTLTGGGSRSRQWQQIAADIFGIPMRVPENADSAALGAALQALWYLDSCIRESGEPLETVTDEHLQNSGERVIHPSSDSGIYTQGYNRYLGYLDSLKPLYQ